MKFDICLPNAVEGFLAPTNFAGPEEIRRFAIEAERLGYHALWGFDFVNPTPDMQIAHGEVANWYELMTTLAYVAGVTQRIRLVAGVVVLPNREPIILAKQIATVDQFSGGRLDLGIGLGLRPEFKTMQPRMSGVYRGELVDEKLEALQLLLRAGSSPVSYSGKHVAFKDINLNPKPLQNPLPMLTAAETAAPLKRAARWGINPIIHMGSLDERLAQFEPALEEAGRSIDEFEIVVWADLRVDSDQKTAAERYLSSVMAQFAKQFRQQEDEAIIRRNWIGTVEEIVEQLVALKRRGVDRIVVMHTVNDDFEEMLDQTQLFAEEIMPQVENA
jgi:alkanesulfonate monooxygenase SsuD/methylene tetrahydromethanopterin reductase-like flavin-dependent oxidoreductase (luciferase family)